MKNITPYETFYESFLFEQNTNNSGPETSRQQKSRLAKSLVTGLFGKIFGSEGGFDGTIDPIKEVKESLPYKGCGATAPYHLDKNPMSVAGIKRILFEAQKSKRGNYSRIIRDLDEKRAVIVGIRNHLAKKKMSANQDLFIDGLYFVPAGAKDDDQITPYQITTVPSLAYYGKKPINPKGTGIKLAGDTLYHLGEATLGGSKYEMMLEGEKINVGRYQVGIDRFDSYLPSTQDKEHCGMHIHRSSTKGKGICVGPWSAGCQVFADYEEWKKFIAEVKKATINNNKFFYGLVELDNIDNDIMIYAQTGKEPDIKSDAGETASKADMSAAADRIWKAIKGTGTDEETIYSVLGQLKSTEDFYALESAFGMKKSGLYKEHDLVWWLKHDLKNKEIDKVNAILGKIGEGGELLI